MSHQFRAFTLPSFALAVLCFLILTGCGGAPEAGKVAGSAEWPQFRGPGGQGVSEETNLPTRWRPAGKNFRWKTRIPGEGDSSPVVSGGRVFLTTTYGEPSDDRDTVAGRVALSRVVLAVDLKSGEILWQTPLFTGRVGKYHWLNTHATPTPVADDGTLYVSFDAVAAALDYDGNVLWKKDLDPTYYEHARYGVASSPVVTRKAVVIFQDREEDPSPDAGWLAALDKKTGEQLWRKEWHDSCCSYTTPVLLERDSRELLIVTTSHNAYGFDPNTGEELWKVQHKNIQPVPSVAVWNDLVTFPGAIHDALLSTFRLGAIDEEPEFVWATRRAVPDMPSPLYYQGRLYTLKGMGGLVNRDPVTGKELWQARLPTPEYRAALVAGDGKIYATSDKGTTAVIAAGGKTFRLIRENRLGEGSGATPAIADGCLIIRGSEHLFCIEKRAEEESDAA